MPKHQIRELFNQYVGGMKEWQIKLAIARMLRFRVPPEAWPDTMQELAMVIHEFTFDAAKAHAASEKTILCRLLDHRIRMLARCNGRHQRFMDRLGQMRQVILDLRTPEDAVSEDDVPVLLAHLTPLQQQICKGLMLGLSISRIAAVTGRHQATIRRQIGHIRQALTNQEGDAWLP
jgi:DNA-directed RNA polymerase specialized sigma24 family protein